MRANQFSQLTAFVAVAQHRNFTKAATHLGLSPPTLSQTVRSLENRLGVRLLNRTTRSVALTTAGERLLAHMQPLLEGIDKAVEAVNQFRDTPMGCLRLTASRFAAVMIVGPLIGSFLTEYPDIRVELFVDDSQSDIVSGRFDAGVRWGERIDKDMIAVRMGGGFRMIPVASPAYLARNPPPDTPKDLRTHRCIHYRHTWNGAIHRWMFEKDGEQIEMAVEGAVIVNDMDLALGAARDGLGIAYVPEATARSSIEDGRLVPLLEDWCRFELDFFLYYSSRRQMPPPLQTLIAFIRKHAHGSANAKGASEKQALRPMPLEAAARPAAPA
jgi:DNA-binding transcriptional LysR family regulator